MDKLQRRSHFAPSHHSLSTAQGFVDEAGSQPEGLAAGWPFMSLLASRRIITRSDRAGWSHSEAGRCCKGLDAPSQHWSTHSGYQVIPAHCLSEWCFMLTSHTSHGCILFSASHNFFYSFFFFLNSSYGFLSPPYWFPCTLHGHSCCWGCCTISLQHDPQTG